MQRFVEYLLTKIANKNNNDKKLILANKRTKRTYQISQGKRSSRRLQIYHKQLQWTQHCWMLHVLHVASVCAPFYMMLYVVVACCWDLLCKVWKQLNFWAHNSQHFFCSIRDCQAQHCCSSNIVRANHTHYTWSSKSHMYGLYPSHNMHCRSQHCWE